MSIDSEQQSHSQKAQSAEEVRQLKEYAAQVNLALDEARRLRQSMSGSLSWKLTAPLRVLRDATAAKLRKVKWLHSDRRSSTQKETPLFLCQVVPGTQSGCPGRRDQAPASLSRARMETRAVSPSLIRYEVVSRSQSGRAGCGR